MKDIELLDGKLMFHSYKALKTYCDNPDNPLDVVVLGKEIDSLHRLFYSSSRTNEQFAGIENWDVSNVKDMSGMFCFAENFNQPLNNWDVSKVKDMSGMFRFAENFNQPLNNWDVSNVRFMDKMFEDAYAFNQPLNSWDVSNVTDMHGMFWSAEKFNQPLNNWDVSKVGFMSYMFCNAHAFNQPLNNWDLSREPDGAEELERFRQSKAQVVEQKESKKKVFHR